jgi:hypothetical protein
MHNASWNTLGILKLGTLVISKHSLKTPRPKVIPKHYVLSPIGTIFVPLPLKS